VSYQQQGHLVEDGEERGFKASKVYKEETESSEQDEDVDILEQSADSVADDLDRQEEDDDNNEEYDDEEDEM